MVEAGLLKGVWNSLRSIIQYTWKWAHPPKIGFRLAPPNLLEVVRPYAYRGRVLEELGEPHHVWRGASEDSYRFSDALLQIRYSKDDYIDSVTLVALTLRWPHRFTIHPLTFKLGRENYEKVCRDIPVVVSRDFSSKFMTYWKTEYFGFPGSYLHFSFASISAATWPPVKATGVEVEERKDDVFLLKNANIKFNAVAISIDAPEVFPFTWSSFQ
jgi:hypothetical protein